MGGWLGDMAGNGGRILHDASYVFDPANIFGTRGQPQTGGGAGPGLSPSVAAQGIGQAQNVLRPSKPQFLGGMLPAPQMGAPAPTAPVAPPPPPHWSYQPGKGAVWATPKEGGKTEYAAPGDKGFDFSGNRI